MKVREIVDANCGEKPGIMGPALRMMVGICLTVFLASSALAQYGAAILNKVNFAAKRVRPNFSLDASAGATLYHKEGKEISVQLEANNLTDRLNILNFASLFSGTAVASPRSVSARLKAAF